jgi:hypothetical protein
MSAQIGAARPAPRAGAEFGTISSKDILSYATTWYAYFGRFEVDEAQSQVRHFVDRALFAFETGKTLVRSVHLENDVLTLRTVNLEQVPDGETFNRLTWTRVWLRSRSMPCRRSRSALETVQLRSGGQPRETGRSGSIFTVRRPLSACATHPNELHQRGLLTEPGKLPVATHSSQPM